MSQLHFYVPDELEKQLREEAAKARLPLSRFLAELVKNQAAPKDYWPDGYFEQVFGCWVGEPLQREDQGDYESRDRLE